MHKEYIVMHTQMKEKLCGKMWDDFEFYSFNREVHQTDEKNVLTQIYFILQQTPHEILHLICGEVGTNAHSTLGNQLKNSSLSAQNWKFCMLL